MIDIPPAEIARYQFKRAVEDLFYLLPLKIRIEISLEANDYFEEGEVNYYKKFVKIQEKIEKLGFGFRWI